jgi:hypothetical protein
MEKLLDTPGLTDLGLLALATVGVSILFAILWTKSFLR